MNPTIRPLVAVALLTSLGCSSVAELRRDMKDRVETPVTLTGTVRGEAEKPIVVVLLAERSWGEDGVDDCWVLDRPGPFSFLRRAGTYRLFAFVDRNENFAFDRDEPAGWHGAPSSIRAVAGARLDGLDIALRSGTKVPDAALAGRVAAATLREQAARRHAGRVSDLRAARFAPETGKLGLWDPVRFHDSYGTGVWFLEPYDPAKIPVLLVHGASGYPQEWAPLVSSLDRSRFQPWVFQYPSGARLDAVSDTLAGLMNELRLRHGFRKLFVVAHSMGGLVSRATIPRLEGGPGGLAVGLFVTISTPWLGHDAAGLGVVHSPFVIPSWNDMAPDSEFLGALRKTPLSPSVAYHLFFGYRGGETLFMRENSDESVTLQSMLDPGAQDEAVRIHGFFEDHTSILRSADVARKLAGLMRDAAARP